MSYKLPKDAYQVPSGTITFRELSRRISTEAMRLNGHLINHPILQHSSSQIGLPEGNSRPKAIELYRTSESSVYYAILQVGRANLAVQVKDTGIEPKLDMYGNPEKGSEPRFRLNPLGTLETIANSQYSHPKN